MHPLQVTHWKRYLGSSAPGRGGVWRWIGLGLKVSPDGRGRALDNVMVERLWRTVRCEGIYLRDCARPAELRQGLGRCYTTRSGPTKCLTIGRQGRQCLAP